jgi:hypothetical protein
MTQANERRSIWFPAKRHGWGWGLPVTWQGWLVLIAWLVVVLSVAPVLAAHSWIGFGAFMFLMADLLIGICYVKGETPRWRWGK